MKYIAPLFKLKADAADVPVAAIDSFMWDENGCKPESYAQMFAVENEGIYARLWSFEEDIRCLCTMRDDPVYTDSCLELFLMPVEGDHRYINFEVNPKGIYLSQIGALREGREFVKELISIEPEIKPFEIEESSKKAWGYDMFISDDFISSLYGVEHHTKECSIKGNFYKCGDKTPLPHYGSHFPVKTNNPDFHRPEFFGDIIFRKV